MMMKLFEELNEENFLLFAAKNYRNPQCTDVAEFYDDIARFKYVKRLLRKYAATGVIQERLVLNHIIILYNVFGIEAANRMVFFKIEPELHSPLKTFLVFLDYLGLHDRVEVPIDPTIANILRKI